MSGLPQVPDHLCLFTKDAVNASNTVLSYTWNVPQYYKAGDRVTSAYVSLVGVGGNVRASNTNNNEDDCVLVVLKNAGCSNVISTANAGIPIGLVKQSHNNDYEPFSQSNMVQALVPSMPTTITLELQQINDNKPMNTPVAATPWTGCFILRFDYLNSNTQDAGFTGTMSDNLL